MPDSLSSSSPQVSLSSDLPDNFTLYIGNDEFEAIVLTAIRHAPSEVGNYSFTVQFGVDTYRWFFVEENVTTWFDTEAGDVEDAPTSGLLTLPVYFLDAIRQTDYESASDCIELRISRTDGSITYKTEHVSFSTALPQQAVGPFPGQKESSSRIFISSDVLAQAGMMLQATPVVVPRDKDGFPVTYEPFAEFSYDGTDLVVSRDWSKMKGPVVSMRVHVGGDYRGTFSMFAPFVARELTLASAYGDSTTTIEFYDEQPNICRVSGKSWGVEIQLAHEYVVKYRSDVEEALTMCDAEIDLVPDTCEGWNPVVEMQVNSRTVTAAITPDVATGATYVRLNTNIISNLEWTEDVARELNSWNDQWPTVKLLHTDGVVHVVADVPVAAIPTLGDTVIDLVTKAQIVDDLIAAVL